MPKTISITKTELQAALRALKRTGPVLGAHKKSGYIILYLCGDKEPIRWKPPAKRKQAPKPKSRIPKPKSGETT